MAAPTILIYFLYLIHLKWTHVHQFLHGGSLLKCLKYLLYSGCSQSDGSPGRFSFFFKIELNIFPIGISNRNWHQRTQNVLNFPCICVWTPKDLWWPVQAAFSSKFTPKIGAKIKTLLHNIVPARLFTHQSCSLSVSRISSDN